MSKNTVNILFFGPARDLAGTESVSTTLSGPATAGNLRAELMSRYPGLKALERSMRLAVNERFVGDDDPVQPGDEVALIPPVSGG